MQNPNLVLQNVNKDFGSVRVLQDLSLVIKEGITTALIGPNGAGKTTVFNVITGLVQVDSGSITWRGRNVTNIKPYQLSKYGIGRTYQDLKLFESMTVHDNVRCVVEQHASAEQRRTLRQRIDEILHITELTAVASRLASELSYAEKKFLSIARLLAINAELLLLDEPTSGMDHQSLEQFKALLKRLVNAGSSICIVEHNLEVVKDLADEIAFLQNGHVVRHGKPEEIVSDPELAAIYFGTVGDKK
ncbi:ATP-binding cassette domain-containing protein [Alicyclobacillus tolerans]|uniref:ABC transporter ATP-binding protein n=1 Tax=Alicyclobacillus tolerans TaxID=90970 RepID=UPI001EFFB3DB|nr:ATP-binding cassette domain-containing protein [Alicyclobacillus tolerans]MCF8565749.1 ATP-binding cassette domain-containing protein [Alicyclobacillus tolerans]